MVKLVLVDKKNRKRGLAEKKKAHLGKGLLHRAFTVLIFNGEKKVLIQQRSKNKFLWPLIWETSCSSHPLPGESSLSAAKKRLKEELGFTCFLKSQGIFYYQANYKNIGAENEACALLTGQYNGKVRHNPKEVSQYKWISLKELKKDIKKNPKKYAPWLKIPIEKINKF